MDTEIFNNSTTLLNKQPNIDAVYLFGSGARGNMREKSDIDLAMLFSIEAGNKLSRFDQLLAIAIDLESITGRHVDVAEYIADLEEERNFSLKEKLLPSL